MQREVWVCVCDLISGRQRHTTQKEWYAERQTYTHRETDRHTHAYVQRGRRGEGQRAGEREY